jgi:hypothetical protein
MTQQRQRHIPLNIDERRELDRRKRDYEDLTGDSGDWARFLRTVTLAGLAALGVYEWAHAVKRAPTVWQVDCTGCGSRFPVRVPNPLPWRLADVKCPNCSMALVMDFAQVTSTESNGHEALADRAYAPRCRYCQQPIRTTFSRLDRQGLQYLECANCGRVAVMRGEE